MNTGPSASRMPITTRTASSPASAEATIAHIAEVTLPLAVSESTALAGRGSWAGGGAAPGWALAATGGVAARALAASSTSCASAPFTPSSRAASMPEPPLFSPAVLRKPEAAASGVLVATS